VRGRDHGGAESACGLDRSGGDRHRGLSRNTKSAPPTHSGLCCRAVEAYPSQVFRDQVVNCCRAFSHRPDRPLIPVALSTARQEFLERLMLPSR
jgi:hypothetical protein